MNDKKSKNKTVVWQEDQKEMIFIAGGNFIMGSDTDAENNAPAHLQTLSDFYIDRYPVTCAEYKRFIDATGHPIPNYDVPWCKTDGFNWNTETKMYPEGRANHPVVLVTWADAVAYATWAGKRLPTEAEWEFVARGSKNRHFPWGMTFLENHCNSFEAHFGDTTPVGTFSPQGDSPEGVSDMLGNVWEWTSSLYRLYPYRADDGREDMASDKWRVLRGGSWVNDATSISAITRLDGDFLFYNNVGFRCAVGVGRK